MPRVNVTAGDIAEGVAGDCWRCPVGLALARATGDEAACVHELDCMLRVEVWGRSVPAPGEVRRFVRDFDALPRDEDGRPDAGHPDYAPPGPFEFQLPESDDAEWEEQCCHCEGLFDSSELDDEGICEECRDD